MLKELPKEGLVNLMYLYIFNAILRLEYLPKSLKIAQIMIPKPGKNPIDVSPYRPISLLPTISKVLEKLMGHAVVQLVEALRYKAKGRGFGSR
jgi:hypothetical protein